MKRIFIILMMFALLLTGCVQEQIQNDDSENMNMQGEDKLADSVEIVLNDDAITVDGEAISEDTGSAVYAAKDIVYYPAGKDFTFGEGTQADEHEDSEANLHTVVHITRSGTYSLSGSLSAGQIAVDLGEDAENDPNAVVNLILNGVDISCTVAPAVIFYNVYECGTTDAADKIVDTALAGANVFIADGTVNNVNGSYVARIYKPDSVELSEDGTEVVDSKKLHKYDAAFYSKMSMNVNGNDGVLNITAENEGLDSELHLTINGGDIRISSGNDGINTNEDGVSVTTINGGKLTINVLGTTGEGDGIDSNGWLVINGGTVVSAACSFSGDAGIDSDMGIYINGGTVMATGNMLDRIAGGEQTYAVFTFASRQKGGKTYTLKNAQGTDVMSVTPVNDFTYLILAGDELAEGEYTFYNGDIQLGGSAGQGFGGMGGMMRPEGMTPPNGMAPAEGMIPPEKMEFPEGERPENMIPPADGEFPISEHGGRPGGDRGQQSEISTIFTVVKRANYFLNVTAAEQ